MENRKMGGDHEDDPEEERKMDKFYSLLRSFRNARDRRRKDLEDMEKNDVRRKQRKQETSSWVPSFEWEDFTTEMEFRKPTLVIRNTGDGRDKGKEDDGLDLKLGL